MSTPPQNPIPTNIAEILSLLQATATSLTQASASVNSAANLARPTATNTSQIVRIIQYLVKKAAEGAAIGVVVLIAGLLDTSGTFAKFIAENFTQMPLVVMLGGVLGGYIYVLNPVKTNLVGSISKTWLDLIQQYFTVGVGAFWLIKCGLFLREISRVDIVKIEWTWDPTNFYVLLFGAILTGGMYELRDEPISPPIKWMGVLALISALIIFIPLMLSPEGDKEFIRQTKEVLKNLYSFTVKRATT